MQGAAAGALPVAAAAPGTKEGRRCGSGPHVRIGKRTKGRRNGSRERKKIWMVPKNFRNF